MKLPNHEQGVIPKAKITDYLLSLSHPDGHGKAIFFLSFGFTIETWEILAEALRRHAASHEVTKVEPSPFGTRYVIEGIIATPDGRTPAIRAIWFTETGEQIPRFATAYPLSRRAS
jgi:hypothetical protein